MSDDDGAGARAFQPPMTLHAPQIIFLVLTLLNTGIYLAKHGEPRTGRYSFGSALLSDAIVIGLLYWGGFFG